jgi:hypothetical protein
MSGDPGAGQAARDRAASVGAAALLLGAVLLPFLRGLLAGHCFYFRDLSLYFFPLRRFVIEGLRAGELRSWNPYVHEGVPLALPPVAYPFDLFQVLFPNEAGFTLFLALHVPLAALAFFALGRRLGLSRLASSGGALVYALGGFCLSTLNLYVYVQALAWAPLVVRGLLGAAEGGRRAVAGAAVLVAVMLSTTGAEIAAQALVLALLLVARPWNRRVAARFAAAVLLGISLAGAVVLPLSAIVADSARGSGFPTDVVLAHSVHPIAFLQVLVAGLFGDPYDLAERWWGMNFFPRGFPYVLSLYLGPAVLTLAAVGLIAREPRSRRVAFAAALAALVCLGRWAGLEPLVEAVPLLHKFRFPVKAFFTIHIAVALLAALGLSALARGREGRAWKACAGAALGAGTLVVALPRLVLLPHALARYLLDGFFAPDYPWPLRWERARFIAADAGVGGGLALVAGLVAVMALSGRLQPERAAVAVAALAAVDLLRAGAGLNPMVSPAFYRLSAETAHLAEQIRREGGRLFTFDPAYSEAYLRGRAARPERHEAWTFAVLQETFTPDFNAPERIPTAYSLDRTMLVPVERVLQPAEASAGSFPSLRDRLRAAAVAHVVSLDPIDHPDLEPRAVLRPARIAPLEVHVYRLRGARPLVSLAGDSEAPATSGGRLQLLATAPGRFDFLVRSDRRSLLTVREAFAPGWRATVDGGGAAVVRTEGRHLGVGVGPGEHRVRLRYAPPSRGAGLGLSVVSGLAVLWLGRPAARR